MTWWRSSAALASALLLLTAACGGDEAAAGGGGQGAAASGGAGGAEVGSQRIRLGQFNLREMSTDKLVDPADEQANAAAEILARFAPDIVSVNELQFDLQDTPTPGMPGASPATARGSFDVEGADNARRLAERIAAAGGADIYPHTLLFFGNSGLWWEGDTLGEDWYLLRGWGEFRGRFNTAVLSRFPILVDQVRVITELAWQDVPGNCIAQMESEIGIGVPAGFPLFEKALHIVPIQIGDQVLDLILHHPVTPAFDPINPYRNHDELLALRLLLDGELPGEAPLSADAKFVILGDLNADPDDGDGIPGSIQQILDHPSVVSSFPAGSGTAGHNGQHNSYLSGCGRDDGSTVDDPTVKFQLQLDYILPSTTVGEPLESLLFFPDYQTAREDFDLACRASDHRFLYSDLAIGGSP